MIARGEVRLNGKVVTELPVFVNVRADKVAVNGRPIELDGAGGGSRGRGRVELKRVYIAVNKPDRTLAVTRDDPYGTGEPDATRGARRTVLDLVTAKGMPRLFPVGRLGFHDTGLVILTNDGELANRLTHARYGVPRTYVLVVRGRVPEETMARMSRRLALSLGPDHPLSTAPIRTLGTQRDETEIEVTLRESPKLRIDALVFEAGLKVKRLVRTAIGPVSIRGIASGDWKFLDRNELEELQAAAGLVGAAPRGRKPAERPEAARPRRNAPGKVARGVLQARGAERARGPKPATGRPERSSADAQRAEKRPSRAPARGPRAQSESSEFATKRPRRILPGRSADRRGGAAT